MDEGAVSLEVERELGRNVCSAFVTTAPGAQSTFRLGLEGSVPLAPGGWYELDVVKQPTLRDDQLRVRVVVPEGWHVAEVRGLERVGPREATFAARWGRPWGWPCGCNPTDPGSVPFTGSGRKLNGVSPVWGKS